MQIEELEEEYKALSEVYRANLEARRAVSKYCQELEEKILDLCKRHAATICSIEEDAKQEIRHQTERFKQRLQQNQNTCSQLTAELCKLRSENKALSERLQVQASRRKK
ncbi:candidate inclusion membrane protein [Chlamydia trachomatis]|nr:candidate inclusion membrane protein [Chlamydia trachomatis]